MNVRPLTLVMGGVRSGKSAFAESLIGPMDSSTTDSPVVYLATGLASDAEMEQRIQLHRQRRPSHWITVEEPLDLAGGITTALNTAAPPTAVIIDSIDVWVANMLMEHEDESKERLESLTLSSLDGLLEVSKSLAAAIMVSAEVGLSLVPPEPLGRRFQDLLGLVNQRIAAAAGMVYLVVAGIPLEIKGRQGMD